MKGLRWMTLALLAVAAVGCPKRTVVVDGVEVDYGAAASDAFAEAELPYREGRYGDAVGSLERYLVDWPEAKEAETARYFLARSYEAIGDAPGTQRAWEALLLHHPGSAFASSGRLYLGLAHLRRGEHGDALQVLKGAWPQLEGAERRAAAQGLAEASLGLERWVEAVRWVGEIGAHAQNAAERDAADATLIDLIDGKVPALGLAALREELSPSSAAYPLVLFKLAKIHYHLGDFTRSRQSIERYLELSPRGPFAEAAREMGAQIDALQEVRPEVVGVVLPMSGRLAPFGEAVLKGIGVALDLERGVAQRSKIKLVVKDSQGDPAAAAAAVEALVREDKAIAIIGPLLTTTAPAAALRAQRLGVPLISLSRAEGVPQVGPWIYRTALTDAAQAQALVAFAQERLKAETVGLLYSNHPAVQDLIDHLWTAVEARRMEMRAAEGYAHDQKTFSGPIKRMVGRYRLDYRPDYRAKVNQIRAEITDPYRRKKAMERAVSSLRPITDFDVLIVPDQYRVVSLIAPAIAAEDVITNVCDSADLERIRQTMGREPNTLRLLGTNGWNHPDLIERAGKYVDCAIFVDGFYARSRRPATQRFVSEFQNLYGKQRPPGYLEATGHDAAALLRAVIEGAKPQTRAALRDSLSALRGFEGATGTLSFDNEGEITKPLFFLTVDGWEIKELDLDSLKPIDLEES